MASVDGGVGLIICPFQGRVPAEQRDETRKPSSIFGGWGRLALGLVGELWSGCYAQLGVGFPRCNGEAGPLTLGQTGYYYSDLRVGNGGNRDCWFE